jgi:hypothetical protein
MTDRSAIGAGIVADASINIGLIASSEIEIGRHCFPA